MSDETKKPETNAIDSNALLAPFKTLALGARFKYTERGRTWVKLGNDGVIAEWDAKNISNSWFGQSICSFNDEDNFDVSVHIVG